MVELVPDCWICKSQWRVPRIAAVGKTSARKGMSTGRNCNRRQLDHTTDAYITFIVVAIVMIVHPNTMKNVQTTDPKCSTDSRELPAQAAPTLFPFTDSPSSSLFVHREPGERSSAVPFTGSGRTLVCPRFRSSLSV